ELAAARAALARALEVAPTFAPAARLLAQMEAQAGNAARAREILTLAAARVPNDIGVQGQLAELCWQMGEREAALAGLEPAIRRARRRGGRGVARRDRARARARSEPGRSLGSQGRTAGRPASLRRSAGGVPAGRARPALPARAAWPRRLDRRTARSDRSRD